LKLSPWVLALIISCSLSYGQYYGKDLEDMSQTEKMMMYNSYNKTPMAGVLYSWLFPSLGHAYANNWKRGTLFLLGQTISITSGILLLNITEHSCDDYGEYCDDYYPYKGSGLTMLLIVTPIITIWEKVDAYKEVKKYNNRLYKDIFDKELPSFSLNLQPTYQGANLNLSYSFK